MLIDFLLILGIFSFILILIHIVLSFENEDKPSLFTSLTILVISLYFVGKTCDCWLLIQIFLLILIMVISITTLMIVHIIERHLINDANKEHELLRKAFHLVALILFIPKQQLYVSLSSLINILYHQFNMDTEYITILSLPTDHFLSQLLSILALESLFVFLVIEIVRIHTKKIDYPRILARKKERNKFAAEFYTAIAVFAVSLSGSWSLISAVLSSALLGDSAAALIGKHFGRIKIRKDRSLEGTITEFFVAFVCSIFFVDPIAGLLVAIFIVLTDIFITTFIQDNLLFPVVAMLAVYVAHLVI
ncbi:MAG: hypothetical protein ACP6IP_08995 [Candidatus Njordarchaeia archaeon]